MGATKKTARRQPDVVTQLSAQVQALTARLDALEGGPGPSQNGNGHHDGPQSRRDLLKIAGAAAAGAAGTLLLRSVPAAALDGDPVTLGSNSNDAASTTDILPTGVTAPAPLFQATGQDVDNTQTVPATVSEITAGTVLQSVPLIGAIGPSGTLPPIGAPKATNDYPGFAPIQGVGGKTTIGGKLYSEGVNGFGSGSRGIGVSGESDTGYGLVGGSGGIDIAALGLGRVLQFALPDDMLTSAPAGPPTYNNPNDFEQVRDSNGVLWLSGPGGAWRRDNSLRVDTPAGTAAFTPARLLDTRSGAPLNGGTTYTFGPFNGTHGLPTDAVGIVGNLTVVDYTGAGYVSIFPGGVAWSGTSSLNFAPPFAASGWANSFTVGFGTGANTGKISIRFSANGIKSHVVIDVTGYLQ